MPQKKLVHTMLRVKDMEKSLEFYVDKLGMRLRDKKELRGADATLAFVTDPQSGYEIELTYNHDNRDYTLGDQYGHMAFYVDNLESTYEEWKARGVSFSLAPKTIGSGSRIAFAVDPDGFKVELIERPAAFQ